MMIRRFFLLSLLFLLGLLSREVQAQQPASFGSCQNGQAEHFEIGLIIEDEDHDVFVTVYNEATQTTEDSRWAYGDQDVDNTGCHWVAHVGEPATGPGRAEISDNVPLTITFEVYEAETKVGAFSYTYSLCHADGDLDSFYCPDGAASDGLPDVLFYLNSLPNMRVYPVRFANIGASGNGVDDYFTGSNWILPYQIEHVCAAEDESPCPALLWNDIPFLTPQAAGSSYTLAPGVDVVVPAGRTWTWEAGDVTDLLFPSGTQLVVEGTANLTEATLLFPFGAQLVVEGTLDLTEGTLTAADMEDGWHGIYFAPGSSGSLRGTSSSDRLTIGGVNGVGTASVYVDNAEVDLEFVEIDGRPQGNDIDSRVHGIYAKGSSSEVSVTNVIMDDHTEHGITIAGGARLYASESNVDDTVFGYGFYGGADLFLWDNPGISNAGADYYGTLWLAPPDSYNPPLPNNTIDHVSGPALVAYDDGEVVAGITSTSPTRNNYLLHGTAVGYVKALASSDITARYNWWGDAGGPDLVLSDVDTGSTFEYCPWLIHPTSGATGGSCASKWSQEGASELLGRARSWVDAGRYDLALGDLQQAAEAAGTNNAGEMLHRRALRLMASLLWRAEEAGHAKAVREAEAFLKAATDGPERPWALRALAQVAARRGEHEAALGWGGLLAATGGNEAATGHLIRAFALASLGQEKLAEEALREAEAASPGAEQVARARRELVFWLGRPLKEGGLPASGAAKTDEHSHASIQTEDHPLLGAPALEVYPHPVASSSVVVLTLAEASEVRLAVYDVLGRTVALLHEGHLVAGVHEIAFNTRALPAGTYLLRAVVAQHMLSRPVAVVR